MRIAVTGASGQIGTRLVPALEARGHEVVRLVRREAHAGEARWDPAAGSVDRDALGPLDAVVHLAGENLGQRWSDGARRRILDSRVEGTRTIAQLVATTEPMPALVCASAVGAYGDRGDEVVTEETPTGAGFQADVVRAWEAASDPAREAGARVVIFRQGVVLDRRGGALARMLLPFRLGVGGRVGSGRQWFSWIGPDDVVAGYVRALEGDLHGLYNLTSPNPITNAELTKALGRVLRRPTVFVVPRLAIRTIWGAMGEEVLLGSLRVVPARLQAEGFTFAQASPDDALRAALA
jgi:uncharacterized protein (TIGR01777 family)